MKSINSTVKAQRIFIWLLVVIFPLVRSSETIEPDSHLKMMSLSGILMAFLVYNYYKAAPVKIITNIVITGFACYILYSIFGLASGNFPDALFEWYQVALVFLTAFLFANYIQLETVLSELPKAFTVLALILACAGIKDLAVVINEGQLVIPGNTYSLMSFFGHRNLFAQILFFTFPFTIYAVLFPGDKLWRIVSFVSVLSSFFFLIILSNRATWLSLVIGGAVVLINHLYFVRSRKHLEWKATTVGYKRLILGLSTGLILAIFFYLKYSDVSSVEKHTADIVNFEKGSTKDHLSLWKKSFQLIAEKPVLGNGLASWKTEILKYGNEGLVSENNATFYQTPHNDFLWICSQQGFIGLLMYVFLFVAIAFTIYKNFRKANTAEQFYFINMLQFLFIGYVIYSFFSFPKERTENFLQLGILAGCLVLTSGAEQYSSLRNNVRHFFVWTICLILLGGMCLGFTRYKSEIHLAKSLKAKSENNNQVIIREIPKAYSSFYKMDPVSTPLKWYSGSALFNLGKYKEALTDLQQARELNPYHIHVLNNLASCYEMLGDHQSAIKFYKEAVSIAPNFEDVWLNLCAIYFNLQELNEAYTSLRKIDLTTTNPKFSQFLQVVLRARLMEIAHKTNDRKMEEFLNGKVADNQWLLDLHSISMKQQVLPEKLIKSMY